MLHVGEHPTPPTGTLTRVRQVSLHLICIITSGMSASFKPAFTCNLPCHAVEGSSSILTLLTSSTRSDENTVHPHPVFPFIQDRRHLIDRHLEHQTADIPSHPPFLKPCTLSCCNCELERVSCPPDKQNKNKVFVYQQLGSCHGECSQ